MKDVFIHGSGVIAHTMAVALAQLGLRVSVSKPDRNRTVDARAFAITQSSKDLLDRLGAWPNSGVSPVARMRVFSITGTNPEHVSATTLQAPFGDQPVAWMAEAGSLATALASALGAHPCITVESQASHTANATLEIICEGKDSKHALLHGARIQSIPYLQSAVAARLQVSAPHENTANQWFKNGEVLAFLPLGKSEPGNFMAMVWSVSHERAAHLQSLSPTGLAAQAAMFSRGQLGDINMQSIPQSWPVSMSRPSRFFGPFRPQIGGPTRSWVLAGDAAHTVHPLAGLGLNLGLSDVEALSRVLAQRQHADHWRPLNDPRLLRQYERDRQSALAKLIAATDGIFQLFRSDLAPLPLLRRWGMGAVDASSPIKRMLTAQVRAL